MNGTAKTKLATSAVLHCGEIVKTWKYWFNRLREISSELNTLQTYLIEWAQNQPNRAGDPNKDNLDYQKSISYPPAI